jgi:hypothetical protein
MSILAIRGHEIRNKEVIGLLEMLGGKNQWNYRGNRIACVYYLNKDFLHAVIGIIVIMNI